MTVNLTEGLTRIRILLLWLQILASAVVVIYFWANPDSIKGLLISASALHTSLIAGALGSIFFNVLVSDLSAKKNLGYVAKLGLVSPIFGFFGFFTYIGLLIVSATNKDMWFGEFTIGTSGAIVSMLISGFAFFIPATVLRIMIWLFNGFRDQSEPER